MNLEEENKVVEVQIAKLIFDESVQTPVVILKEIEGERILPIWIGHPEASSIALALEGVKAERPLTHDLIINILKGLGVETIKIIINQLKENTFFARIILRTENGSLVSIDSRPSDSIALALRNGTKIFVADGILREHSAAEEA